MDDRTEHEKAAGTPDTAPPSTAPDADDVAFARLQAADPAAGADPNLPALYSAVSDRTGVPVTAPGDELAARRARRAPRWLQVAAVVAGVAVIGGGSYAYGLNSAPETLTAAPAISLDDGAARDAAAPETASMAGSGVGLAADAKMMYPWWGGRTVFTASGLSDRGRLGRRVGVRRGGHVLRGDGRCGGCGARGVRAAAARVRHVVGRPQRRLGCVGVAVAGRPREPVLLRPDAGPVELRAVGAGRHQRAGAGRTAEGSVAVPEPAIVDPPAECTTSENAPTGDAAVAQAKDALSSVGVDPAGYQFTTSTDPGSPQVTNVSCQPGARRPADRGHGERHARRRRGAVAVRAAGAAGRAGQLRRRQPDRGRGPAQATRGSVPRAAVA